MSDAIGEVFQWIVNAFSSLFETLFNALKTLFTSVKDLIFDIFGSNLFDMSSLGKSFVGIMESIFNGDFFSSDFLFIILGLIIFVFVFKFVWNLFCSFFS